MKNRFRNVDDFHGSSKQEGVLLLQSYLNILKVRQITLGSVNDESILLFNVPIKAVEDSDVLQKVLQNSSECHKDYRFRKGYKRQFASTHLSSHFQVQQITKYRNIHTPSNTGDSGISDGIADTTISSVDYEKSTNTRRCDPNLCLFGGICDPSSQKCKCRGPYIGKLIFLSDNVQTLTLNACTISQDIHFYISSRITNNHSCSGNQDVFLSIIEKPQE